MNAYTRNLGVCVGIFLLKISAPLVASEEIIVETLAQAPFDECVFYEPNVGSDDRVVTPQEAAAGLNPNDYFKSGLTEQQVADCYAGQGEFSKDGLIGLAKRNQAYVWGLKKKGSKLWFGTGPNVDKLVGGSYFGSNNGRISDSADNIGEFASSKFAAFGVIDEENDIDYGFKVDASFGDYRPPSMYCYDLETETLTRLDLDLDPEDAELNWKTLGLRSVGYTAPILGYPEGIVFIAGPSVTYNAAATTETLPEVLGVNMFALNAATGECIGSKSFPAYSNIRKWLENDGQLYTTVANQDGTGAVLKHNNNPFRPGFPFNFDVVGNLDSGGAEIEAFEGRLFVNTWPGVEGEWDLGGDGLDAEGIQQILTIINGPASLYRSPVVPPGGLRPSQANRWTRVWSSVDYDPDFAMSLHYGGGAMEVFDGYLHWGTMHVNNTAQLAHSIVYGNTPQPNPEDYELGAQDPAYLADLQAFGAAQFQEFVYPQRWISIWRGKNFNRSGGEIDLLYGASTLPTRMKSDVFRRGGDPRGDFALIKWALFLINNLGTLREIEDGEEVVLISIPLLFGKTWDITTTFEDGADWEAVSTGWTPLYGGEGIDTVVSQVGKPTFDFLLGQFGLSLLEDVGTNTYTWSMQELNGELFIGTLDIWSGILRDELGLPIFEDGADLFRFKNSSSPAEIISQNGLDNPFAYGFRNLQADAERDELYAGTANPANLRNRDSQAKLDNQPNNNDGDGENNDETLDEGDGGWELLRLTFNDELAEQVEAAVSTDEPKALANSVDASDAWLLDTQDTTSATVSFASVGAEESGMKTLKWASYPGKFYTVYSATEAEGEWSPVQTYSGTGGTLTFKWDATTSDIRYLKVVESSEAPIASL